jgi:hypothetical protein
VSSVDIVGDDLSMGPLPSKEMAASPEEPLCSETNFSSKLLSDVGEWVKRFVGPAKEFIRVLSSPYFIGSV